MTAKKREPGVYPYQISTGATLWRIKVPVTLNGGTKEVNKRGFKTYAEAKKARTELLSASANGTYSEPSKQPFAAYLASWLDGLQHSPQTTASYRKNVRLHIVPALGSVPLALLTPAMLTQLYRDLEKSGRQGGRKVRPNAERDEQIAAKASRSQAYEAIAAEYGLTRARIGQIVAAQQNETPQSPPRGDGLGYRTVRYIHTIISAALRDAVDADLLPRNPAAKAKPPTAKQAAAPEMHPWSAAQLGAFLAWSRDNSELHAAWYVLAYTGMRRGELLALRWRDVDLATGALAVQRSAGLVRVKGEGAKIETGPPKSGKPRVIDLDPGTVAVVKTWKAGRGTLHLSLAQPDALVFGDSEGQLRHPERFSRTWNQTVRRAVKAGVGSPSIRLHDLRHTHATLLLAAREPVKVVSERLGHASATVTMTVYAHVLPGNQRAAAEGFAALVADASN